MATILERFKALILYFMTFSFYVLCIISEKNWVRQCFACVANITLTLLLPPKPNLNRNACIASKCPEMTNKLNVRLSLCSVLEVL